MGKSSQELKEQARKLMDKACKIELEEQATIGKLVLKLHAAKQITDPNLVAKLDNLLNPTKNAKAHQEE